MTLYNVGQLSSTPKLYNDLTVTKSESSDVFKFEIAETQNINLLLTEIQSANPKVKLYRDNGDGRYGSGDSLLAQSDRSGKSDDFINRRVEPGTYFVRVVRNDNSVRDSIRYDLFLSATPLYPFPPQVIPDRQVPNLLSREQNAGNLSGDVRYSGSISDNNVVDTYQFALGTGEGVDIRLRGLSSDADIQIVRDGNMNRIADSNETMAYSIVGGNSDELIPGFQQPGDYFLQVYQYYGNTPYQLEFEHYIVSPESMLV